MADSLTIALDAMGGDLGPDMAIPGADLVLQKNPNLRLLVFGDEGRIAPLLEAYPLVRERSEFIACSVWVAMTICRKASTCSPTRVGSTVAL